MDIFSTPPRKLLAGTKPYVQGIRSSIDDLTFRGQKFSAHIGSAVILDAPLTRTIEGASTLKLTVHDPEGELRESDLLLAQFDVKVDDLWFRFAGMSRQGHDALELTFQARNVARLRIAPGALKGKRGTYTRAEFWASQVVNEVKGPRIPLWIPELHDVQPIENAAQAKQAKKESGVTRGKGLGTDAGGLDPSAKLEVKGVPANAEQLANGETVLRVGASLGAPTGALVAAICAGTQENNMMASINDGFFAFTDATVASTGIARDDLVGQANWAFKTGWHAGLIESINNGLSPGDAAQQMEGSAYPSLYAQWQSQGEAWVDAFTGGTGTASTTVTSSKDYSFERKATETIWDNGTSLFGEVNWRLFEAANLIYVITEPELLSSTIRMHISDDAPGVDSITYDYLAGKAEDQINVVGRAKDWAAPPGSVAAVHQQGPVDGRYIVSTIESNLLDSGNSCTITLKRPQKPLAEPAPETTTKTIGGSPSGQNGASGDLAGLTVNTSPGSPHWGGAADVIHAVADPIAKKHGCSPGATKEEGHTAGGDHDPAETTAYATDYTGGDLDAFANEIATVLGDGGVVHTYNPISVEAGGETFSAQVLWQLTNPSPGPGDYAHTGHVHVGMHQA